MSERISAWMDGELEGKQARQLLTQLLRDANFRGDWSRYHAIRDCLRGFDGPDFSARIALRLDSEPTVLAPQLRRTVESLQKFASTAGARVAAVGIAAIVGLIYLPGLHQKSPEIAMTPQPKIKLAPERAHEGAKDYVLAHQPYASGNSMQGLAVYVRALSEEAHRAR